MSNIHLKTAIEYIKRSPFQALSAILVLTLTFFVATVLSVLVYASSKTLGYFETRPQIIAFLKEDVTPEQVAALQNRLFSDERIKDVRYVPKEEALQIYKKATSDNPLLGELVSPTIFPASLEFSVKNLSFAKEVIEEAKKEAIVDSVGFTAAIGGESRLDDVVERLKKVVFYLRAGGAVFVGIMAATSFLVLVVIIGMRMATRKGEVEILDLIGATPGFIRSPIILEAGIYATVGALLGWVLAFVIFLYSAPNIISYFGDIPVLPKDTINFIFLFLVILAGELFIGNLLALFGSMLAVSRAQKAR